MIFLTSLSLANRKIVALIAVAAAIFGVLAAISLRQELLPPFSLPTAAVIAAYPGASPSVVQEEVTIPLERSVEGVEGLEQVTSYSNEGVAIIVAEFAYGTNTEDAVQTIGESASRLQGELPEDVTPQVQEFDPSEQPIVQLAVSSPESEIGLARQLENEIVPDLQSIDGVARASVTGVRDRVVDVTLDLEELRDFGLTVDQISGLLQANNVALPAGDLTDNGVTRNVQVGADFGSVEEIENLVVGYRGQPQQASVTPQEGALTSDQEAALSPGETSGQSQAQGNPPESAELPKPVTLGEVAEVEETNAPAQSLTRTNGEPSIGISITQTSDGNTVSISNAVEERIPELEEQLGEEAEISVVFDQAPYIEQSIDGLTTEGLLGLGFAVLAVVVFLVSIRSTLVTAVSIPLSLLVALLALWVWDFSLNVLTLGALAVAVGRVVDDSIVVLENIKRHLEYGEEKLAAITNAVREVAGAITSSTLVAIAVFLPLAFVGGLTGELFIPFSIAVTVALLASLLVALTIIPVLAYWFLKAPETDPREEAEFREERRNPLRRIYTPIIRWTIRRRAITLVLAALVFIGTFVLASRLETNFIDQSGLNTFSISQELPSDTSLAATGEAAEKVEDVLDDVSGVESYQVTVGSPDDNAAVFFVSSSASGSNTASFTVTTELDADQAAIERTLRERLGDLEDAGDITLAAGFTDQLEVIVQADDEETLRAATDRILSAIQNTPDTADATSNLEESTPAIEVRVDEETALEQGLTEAQIAQTVSQFLEGTPVTQVSLEDERRDVLLKLGSPTERVEDLRIPSGSGTVRLGDVAEVQEAQGPVQITRIDGERSALVTATATGQNLGAISVDLQQRLDALDLPEGATYSIGGVTADQQEGFTSLGLAILAAILIAYAIMALTFRSFVQPLILMVSVPFASTGAILLLLLTDTALGLPALMGLLLLVGIVLTNAIVLLDLIRQYREQGMSAKEATMEGGRRRVRPIVMTALATIGALVPLALKLGTGEDFVISQSLAIVVIGGLATSTVLTLILIPVLYTIVEDIKDGFQKRRARRRSEDEETCQEP